MTDKRRSAAVGFHSGELAVQQQAGVRAQAARLAPMVSRSEVRSGVAAFLSETTFAALTARDRTGRLWTSPLLGPPGVLQAASPTTLWIDTTLPNADPLHGLPDGQSIGLIAIDFATRRRVRINGILTSAADGLAVDVEQAYGNCPRYIQRRRLSIDAIHADANRSQVFCGEALRPEDVRLVQAADTFFLGTTHPDSGNDASHRGGPAGFIGVAPEHLWWPDYPGNSMFNSFGNLSVDPTAAVLFVDFRSGATLQLSGNATVRWDEPPAASDEAHTGRRVEFTVQHVIATAPSLRGTDQTSTRTTHH